MNESRVAKVMDANGLDGLIGTRLENVYYLSGVWNVSQTLFPFDNQCYAVVARDRLHEPTVVISTGDWDQTLPSSSAPLHTVHYGTFYREDRGATDLDADESRLKAQTIERAPRKDALEALVAALEELGLAGKRVGIDETAFKAAYRPEIGRRLPKLTITDASGILREIRMIKTNDEVRRIRRSAAVTERAIAAAASIARTGVTEREMAAEFRRSVISQGGIPTFALLRFGRNTPLGQIPSDDTQLAPGEEIWFDVGSLVDGYWSDLARIYVLAEPSEKLRRYYQAALAGEDLAFEIARPGLSVHEFFDRVMARVREAGIPHYRRHHLGHGIGVEVYDPPLLAPGDEHVIEAGMVLNVEMPYYELGWGAVHVEDPFLVGEAGNEWLTTLSRQLGVIDI